MKFLHCVALTLFVTVCLFGKSAESKKTAGRTAASQGAFEHIKVHGKSLEGNLEGDAADRDVFVYLPPSYTRQTKRRYPVVYFMHGYGIGAARFMEIFKVEDQVNKAMAAGTLREMILVYPDAYTLYHGSMYSSSATNGDWETFIAQDLVSWVDGHYRTIPDRMSRGLSGHSMGGYGTIRIGMKHPEVFANLYAQSACCLTANLNPNGDNATRAEAVKTMEDANKASKENNRGVLVFLAQAAAWSPNPKNPPLFLDLPVKDGKPQEETITRWVANAPLAMVDQYVANLKRMHAFGMEVGLKDNLLASNQVLDEMLTRFGVAHTFETYDGDHNSRISEHIVTTWLPFFSKNLAFGAGER